MPIGTQVVGAVVWLALTFGAAAIGSRFLPDEWYRGLKKPAWNPPNWLFGPVWTLLYLLMAIAAWLVWREHGVLAAAPALAFFVLQLVLNAAWSWLFFGRHAIAGALVDILILWVTILITLVLFWRLVPAAGALLLPYLAWVSFATILNATILALNCKS